MLETWTLSWRLAMRHWAIYRKDFIANILPTVTDPAFMLLTLGVGLGAYVQKMDGMTYVQFLAPGLTISTAFFTAFFETSYNFYIRLRYEGIFDAILTSPLNPREILLAETIWVALKGAIMATAVAIVLILFGAAQWQGLLIIPFVGSLIALSCGALGLICTSIISNINQFQTVYALVFSPMFFFSGAFFPIQDLPVQIQWLASISPLYHGVVIAQIALWGENFVMPFLIHGGIIIIMTMILGTIAYRRIYSKLYM